MTTTPTESAPDPGPPGAPWARPAVLELLRCPIGGERLTPVREDDGRWWLATDPPARRYPIIDGVPRLVPDAARSIALSSETAVD